MSLRSSTIALRIKPFYRIVAMILAVAMHAAAQPSPHTAETVTQHLLEWSETLRSFSGEYHLRDERFDGDPVPLLESRIVFRFQEDDVYIEALPVGESSVQVFGYSRLRGVNNFKLKNADAKETVGTVNSSSGWSIPNGAYILPTELFGARSDFSLRQILESGESAVFEDHGLNLFCHRDKDPTKCVDFWLDSDMRIVQMDWVNWYNPDAKTLAELSGIDKLRAATINATWQFGNYLDSNDVEFPTWAVRTEYTLDRTVSKDTTEKYKKHEISLATLIKARMQKESWIETRRLTFTADPAKIQINPNLSDRDFEQIFPEGTKVGDLATNKVYIVEPWYRTLQRWCMANWNHTPVFRYTLFAVSAIGIIVSASIIYRRRRRPAPHRP